MKVSTSPVSGFRFWAAVAVCALLVATLLPLVVLAAPPALLPPPPPPPPETDPCPPCPASPSHGSRPAGGFIELQASFPPSGASRRWPWAAVHWQELWTAVEWQDARGKWLAVEGWQGTLDGMRSGDGDAPTGEKTWWVAEDDLGSGPFRWVVYRARGGRPLATSEPFYLPGSTGATMAISVSLSAP